MQPINKTNRHIGALAATCHSGNIFCMDPYAPAIICQADAAMVTLTN